MAFLNRRKDGWRVIWTDEVKGLGREGRREVRCVGGNHRAALDASDLRPNERLALTDGAKNATQRRALKAVYDNYELIRHREAERNRTVGRPAFETPIRDFIAAVFRSQIENQYTVFVYAVMGNALLAGDLQGDNLHRLKPAGFRQGQPHAGTIF